jgi:hypothetical protein
VAELGAIGRNLNQIARVANQGGTPGGPGREDLQAMLRVAEALRDHVTALLRANQIAWERGAEIYFNPSASAQEGAGVDILNVFTKWRL